MTRIVIAIVLGLVAVGAAVVWGIGQFGGPPPVQSAAREPLVREPELTVAPAATPSTPAPAARSAPAGEPAAPLPDPAPDEPQATQPAPAATDTFRSTLQTQDEPSAKDAAPPEADVVAPASVPEQARAPASAGPEARVAPQQVTPAPAAAGIEAQFKSRRVTYNRPPEKLALNKPVDVSLVVNATDDEDAGKEALEGFKGEIVERDVDLSDTVSAQLTGVGFDISTQTVERQRLSGRTVNRWQWRVTPTEVGQHTLMLEIFGYATGSLDAEPLDAYRDVITVEVEQLDQIVTWARSVQPVFAVLAALAGIGSAIFAFLRFREEKKQTKAASRSES